MIETLKGGKYEKGKLTKTVGMKKNNFFKTGFCFGNMNETETKLKGFSASGKTSQSFSACLRCTFSEVPNKSVTFFILFWDFFHPTWPY